MGREAGDEWTFVEVKAREMHRGPYACMVLEVMMMKISSAFSPEKLSTILCSSIGV